MKQVLLLIFSIIIMGCNSGNKDSKQNDVSSDYQIEKDVKKSDLDKDIEFITDYGSIILRLSDETPKHRNNFIKLVNQKFYDSLLLHRVINNFMIQTGDPESKNPNTEKELGETDLPYVIPAEFNSALFNKKGALAAAREGDDLNSKQASSSTQFYIVHGRVYNDSTLNIAEGRINNWLAYNLVINDSKNEKEFEKLKVFLENETNVDSIKKIKTHFKTQSKELLTQMNTYKYPEAHREVYKTIGGAAHLDQNYTVFGEVVKGIEIIDSIASVQTNESDRPLKDVRIITAKLIKRKDY
jgi:cyclophilin family peptidyl-prolyl cis-trans isomerase